MKARLFIPRDKDLVEEFSRLDPDSAIKVRSFFGTSDCNEHIRLATEMADRILGVRGFFEWSSEPEIKTKPGSNVG
jgi:hypothetical protein